MIDVIDLARFKAHELSARSIFSIREVSKVTCYEFVRRHHYLANSKFFCEYGFGLYYRDEHNTEEMVGCAAYAVPQGTVAMKGWFSLPNSCTDIMELTRLCVLPCLNQTNATSFLLGNTIKMLKRHGIRAVIALADASRHAGSIYQVCNFKYYGLTDRKNDFYTIDGIKNSRAKTVNEHGVWVERTRKHRYCYILDKKLRINYNEQQYPKADERHTPKCCDGTKKVYDARFKEWYTCPVCCGYIQLIKDGENTKAVPIRNVTEYKENGQLYLPFTL